MAELNHNELSQGGGRWSAKQTRAQFAAVAWLRWRILANGFRRKGGTGELVGRILLYPALATFAILPSAAVAVLAGLFTHQQHLDKIVWLLWGTFAYCQLLNIQLGQPGSTFDPTELIRFPLAARNYIYIRLCFGLLSPANVIGTMMAACIAGGVIVAAPGLWLYALLALGVFAAATVLFSRMVFAWVDRWLATRRAREIFTGLIFFFSLGIQWVNFTFNPAYSHNHKVSTEHLRLVADLSHRAAPFLVWLPPEITTNALIAASQGAVAHYLLLTLACALYAAVFLAVFALRTKTEFRGENFSDSANAVSRATLKPAAAKAAALHSVAATKPERTFGLSPVVFAQLSKEFLYVRRNTGILYGLVAPVFLVLIIASRFASRGGSSSWVFPAAVAYTLLAVGTFSYNSFGLEGTGAQFYFLAPVRMRDVMFAKNLLNFLLALTEVVLTFCIVSYIAGFPPVIYALSALLWAGATMLLTTIMGNRRSITTPKKVAVGRMANKQVSQLSALLGMGILMGSATLAAVPVGLALYFNKDWFLLPIFAVFAMVAVYFYTRSLESLDAFALEHREELFAELCKAG
jgi:ABC-2 type transport system permease protein